MKSGEILEIVIAVAVGLLLAGYLLPYGLQALVTGNYTGVDSTVKTIATVLLPILGIIAIALVFVYKGILQGGKGKS